MTDGLSTQLDAGDVPDSVDEAALERMHVVAWVMDESIGVPGTDIRVGLDPLAGAVPVVGDLISGGFSLYIVAEAAALGVSYTTLLRMLTNIAVDVAGGSVPVVGTVFDALWKTNRRNVDLLVAELGLDDADEETGDTDPVTIEVGES